MAKKIVEYKLHAGHIPYFIDDGGYFASGNKMIGVTKDDDECYIPNTLIVLNKVDLKKRLDGMNMKDDEGIELTKVKKDEIVNNWLIKRKIK